MTKVFGGQDERYLTESKVAAIEQGIERILGDIGGSCVNEEVV